MRKTVILTFLAATLAGCAQQPAGGASAPRPPAADRPAGASLAAQSRPGTPQGAVAVYVNGSPIYMEQLHELLVAGYGLQVAQQLIVNELIDQEATVQGVKITDADVRAEHDATVAQMFPELQAPEQRDRALEQWLLHKSFPYELWDLSMRRNAQLNRLADQKVNITDEVLAAEFENRYGRQVRIRHIQLESLESAQAALKDLKAGADFAKLAQERSTNPSGAEGGLLPPFGARTPDVPAAIRQAAMALRNVGDLSNPVQVQEAFHILKLEERIAPKGAKLEDVAVDLRKTVYAEHLNAWKQRLRASLIIKADAEGRIEYVDPILRAKARPPAQTP